MAMQRHCDSCGITYEAKRANSRFCSSTCRIRSHRNGGSGKAPAVVPIESATERLPGSDGPLTASVRARLVEVDRLDSWQGQNALLIAQRLDAETTDTGSSIAALSRQLDVAMGQALDGVAIPNDPLDELRARRERKLGAG